MRIMVKKIKMTTVLVWGASVIFSLALIYVLLISSFEFVIYGDMDYYQQEYEKYSVAEKLNMEMEDIMNVTEEMMAYLRGNRENLVVDTVVNGAEQEFFNESEISHMEDVQELFIAGIQGRIRCLILLAIVIAVLLVSKVQWVKIFSKSYQYTVVGVGVLVGIVGALFATDFYKYFEIFHKIFFEVDTWIFDPNTSLMINMLPEGLFYDMTLRIVMIFLSSILATFIGAGIIRKMHK